MTYDFNRPIDRQAVPGEKWDRFRGRDVLPMWVADMDFAAPPEVIDALEARLRHPVFGYTEPWPSLTQAVIDGIARDHNWTVAPDWLVWLPGVVTGFNIACRAFADPGEGVLVPAPVYPPMLAAPSNHDQQLLRIDLEPDGDGWSLPLDRMSTAAATHARPTRLLLLCNPHNPHGKVFTRDELVAIATRAEQHDWIICSDEIHCGLVLDEHRAHFPIGMLDEAAHRTVTLMAPSKTWNIPALYCSLAIIPDHDLRKRFRRAMRGIVPVPNLLGLVAAEAAYRDGDPWRQRLLATLRAHRDRVTAAVDRIDGLCMRRPEATYLAWIDARALALPDPARHFEAHGLGLSDGRAFGAPGWLRLNFGCPQATLEAGLARLRQGAEAVTRR